MKTIGLKFLKAMDISVELFGAILDNMSWLIDKIFKPFLYILEFIGIYYVLFLIQKYTVGLQLIQNGEIEKGTAYIQAINIASKSANGIILAIAVGLPTFLGTMKMVRKKFIPKD